MKLIFKFVLIILISATYFNSFSQNHDPKKSDQKFASALQIIRLAYVDTVNEEKLTEDAIKTILKELDPHSVYLSKDEIEKANEPLVGNFEGVGIQFDILDDTIVVVTPIAGGPSEKLGIMPGDKICKINNENSTGDKINNDFVVKKLRGQKGSQVTVSIYRRGKKGLTDFTITRDKIPIYSVDAAYIAAPEVGYIKLNKFAASTMDEFNQAVAKLKEKGMKHLILDLQNNSGGYLNTAIELSDEFLMQDKMIVYTEGNNSPKQENIASGKGELEKGRLVLLVNEGSASASEIVAGAVQDWDRGMLIGRRTFGKGLVQRPFTLPDGSVIRLTTAHYYTPSGRCVQKSYSEGNEKYYKDLNERYKHGEYVNPDSIKFPDSLKFFTANKRVIYGGGGIMPDIFVPLDTSRVSDYYTQLIRKGVFTQYSMQYLDNGNREKIKKDYADVEAFDKKFILDDTFMTDFFAYADKLGVKKDDEGYRISENYIKITMKSFLARNLWDYGAFFRIYNEIDDAYNKGLEVIQNKNKFKEYKLQDN
jgi:carboxyl-terminal processing protease